jgi:pimeloyl-ACP methyl ester carboxylesterase
VTLSDGSRMHYIKRGTEGTPVILVHGLMDSAGQWTRNIEALALHHRVWAVDLLGFGYSSRVKNPIYSMKMFSRSICEFMDALNIERASIVGHSLGGAIALEVAYDCPARVDKLVLIAPATYLLQYRPELKLSQHLASLPRAIIGWMMTHPYPRELVLRGTLGGRALLEPSELDLRVRPTRVKGAADALVAMLGSPHESDLPRNLKAVSAPSLIISGGRDHAIPVRHGRYHVNTLPNAEMVVIEEAGHLVHFECPQVVNDLILSFLSKENIRN